MTIDNNVPLLHPDEKPKPFLRWAGGKSWLVKFLDDLLSNKSINNYHEPFLGAASVYLHLQPFKRAFLSDLNKDLIETYNTIKKDVNGVIKAIEKHKNEEDYYYELRQKEYSSEIERAAKFIYLNRTSFNGIYRVNKKGEYNVPFGFRPSMAFNAENLVYVSKALNNAILHSDDFEFICENLKKGDLVFLDPPYTVSHNNNGFIEYNKKLFSLEDQYKLSYLIDFIKSHDAFYILTNAAHHKIAEIFDKKDVKIELKRANLIGGTNAKRGQTTEFLFTNLID